MGVCKGTRNAAREQVEAWHELLAGFGLHATDPGITDVSVTNNGGGSFTVAITRKG